MTEKTSGQTSTVTRSESTSSSESSSTTVRATTTKRLVAGADGKFPWGWRRLALWAALPLFLLASLLTVPFAVAHIENHLVEDAVEQLNDAGIATEDLAIDFDYRDGEATGVLPAGVTAAAADAAVAEEGLLRNFDIGAETVAAPAAADAAVDEVTVGDETAGEDTAAVEASPVAVQASFDGDRAVVTGTVLDDDQRNQVLSAVAAAVAPTDVVDELEVIGGAAEVPGAGDRLTGLTTAIAAVAGAAGWQADLTDEALAVTVEAGALSNDGTVGNGLDLDAVYALPDTIDQVPTTVEVMAPTGGPLAGDGDADSETEVETEIAALQTELDGLQAEIRETVVFKTRSSELSAAARATLDKVVAAMNRYPEPVVEVAGHTDSLGRAASNQRLSEARAGSVVDYLVSAGIDAERLRFRGAGEDEPIDSNETTAGRANNRRVELTAAASFDAS